MWRLSSGAWCTRHPGQRRGAEDLRIRQSTPMASKYLLMVEDKECCIVKTESCFAQRKAKSRTSSLVNGQSASYPPTNLAHFTSKHYQNQITTDSINITATLGYYPSIQFKPDKTSPKILASNWRAHFNSESKSHHTNFQTVGITTLTSQKHHHSLRTTHIQLQHHSINIKASSINYFPSATL